MLYFPGFLNLAFKVGFGNLTQPQKDADSEKNLSCRTIICSLLFVVIIKNDQCITLVLEVRKLLLRINITVLDP